MRTGYCIVSISPVRSQASDRSEMVTQLLFGEVVTIEEINAPWMKIKTYADNYEGYIDLKHIHFLTEKEVNRWLDGISYLPDLLKNINTPWGIQTIFKGSFIPFQAVSGFNIGTDQFTIEDHSVHTQKRDPFELAQEYLNTPYLWGGKTPFGIDCSGLTQMVFRFLDINLPRDASQQVNYGTNVSFDEVEQGDVAFFENKEGKIIHVGICGDNHRIIHASGHVRIDQLTKEGILHVETGLKSHTLHSIKRM